LPSATAVNVTTPVNIAEHVGPQLIPGGLLVTVPVPSPAFLTVRAKSWLNVAETERAWVIDTVQVPSPLHAPPHPMNCQPAAAVATSVTDAPLSNGAEHVAPQSMPVGLLVTCPDPVLEAVSVNCCANAVAGAATEAKAATKMTLRTRI
jgi:hypothetical protein